MFLVIGTVAGVQQVVSPGDVSSSVVLLQKSHWTSLPLTLRLHKPRANEADVPAVLRELTSGRGCSRLSARRSFIYIYIVRFTLRQQLGSCLSVFFCSTRRRTRPGLWFRPSSLLWAGSEEPLSQLVFLIGDVFSDKQEEKPNLQSEGGLRPAEDHC